jgi:murein DD-endopeptidase MepM/ murein hydrolase activator NlpD
LKRVKKYYYNTTTHRFEKLIIPLRTRLLRILGFLSSSLVTALIIVAIAFRFVDSPKTKRMSGDMQAMYEKYGLLQQQINDLNKNIGELEERDNSIYRTVFESAPLPDSIRHGKNYSRTDPKKFAYLHSDELIGQINSELEELRHRIVIQQSSYDTLQHMVATKEQMLASIPAIQPISNKDLSHMASGFGYRIDPIYKTPKMHTGLDFAAAIGTPIYATADGTIVSTSYDEGGYGNHVVINHGYGYGTLYGHMVRIKVHPGEKVKRGQVIGWVGSTGKSTGPHCHYEVIRNGTKIDPIHYFFNDLSATDYERMVHMAASGGQSFD